MAPYTGGSARPGATGFSFRWFQPPIQHALAGGTPGPAARPSACRRSFRQLLLKRYAPACVIINRGGEIVYFHGQTGEYFMQPTGPPTRNVIAKARDGLRANLRGAVQECLRSGQRVVALGCPRAPRIAQPG